MAASSCVSPLDSTHFYILEKREIVSLKVTRCYRTYYLNETKHNRLMRTECTQLAAPQQRLLLINEIIQDFSEGAEVAKDKAPNNNTYQILDGEEVIVPLGLLHD